MSEQTAIMPSDNKTVTNHNFVPQLADRLAKALQNTRSLELDGNNQFHHYKYPTIAQVRGHANEAMSAARLGIIPEITQEGRTTREIDKGKSTNVTFVKLAIHVFAPEGMFTVRWVGESEDMTDKGLAKAVSAGIKSFLLAMMLMPVGEEENDDGETDARKAAQSKRQPAARHSDKGPELKDDYSNEDSGNGKASTEVQVKSAKLRYQPFVAWANEWVKGNGKQYARPNDPNLANMWNLLNRIGALGFAEVTEQNADDIKATLESYVKHGEPDKVQA